MHVSLAVLLSSLGCGQPETSDGGDAATYGTGADPGAQGSTTAGGGESAGTSGGVDEDDTTETDSATTADASTSSGVDTGGESTGAPFDGPAHEALLNELVGFGATTTGGAGGPVVSVTTLDDDGPGSLREAAAMDGPVWIRFEVDGVIALQSNISVRSDKTLDGRGADITITGGGLYVEGGDGNVIVNNLKLRDTPDDILRFFDGGSQMWVHHCDLSSGGDGAFDATEGVTEITVSYTHVFDHDKAMLTGAGSPEGDGESMRWTAHHNHYEDVVQRLPGLRFGWAHTFNNLYEWESGTAIWARLGAEVLVENNILAPQTNVGHKILSTEDGAKSKMVGNLERPLDGDEIEFTEVDPDQVFVASDYYDYTLDSADDALGDRIRAEAGWQDVPFPES
jgi:pectate lyase